METTTQNKPPQFTPGGSGSGGSTQSHDAQSGTDRFTEAAHAAREQIADAAAEKLGQAKQKVSEVYDQVNKNLNDQYDRAVGYSRENPGKTTLIAFGIGVGVGALLLGNLSNSRSRRGRVVEPVMNALSTLAYELFR